MTNAIPPHYRILHNPSAVRWAWMVGAVVVMALGMILLLLLTQSTNNREMYERNYARLFAVNVVV
jgi:hypothetical protein